MAIASSFAILGARAFWLSGRADYDMVTVVAMITMVKCFWLWAGLTAARCRDADKTALWAIAPLIPPASAVAIITPSLFVGWRFGMLMEVAFYTSLTAAIVIGVWLGLASSAPSRHSL